MINLTANVFTTKQFEIDGKKFVTIEGTLENIGIFKQTVPESLVPDSLEGMTCTMNFDVGVDYKFKPSLKLKSIKLS